MSADRIERAIMRIEAAMARIETARDQAAASASKVSGNSARVIELVNNHERLREHVADTLRDIDDLIAKLDD